MSNSLIKKIHIFFLFYYSHKYADIEIGEDCPNGSWYDYLKISVQLYESPIHFRKNYEIKNRIKFYVIASPTNLEYKIYD